MKIRHNFGDVSKSDMESKILSGKNHISVLWNGSGWLGILITGKFQRAWKTLEMFDRNKTLAHRT